jgi:hypothetical protein
MNIDFAYIQEARAKGEVHELSPRASTVTTEVGYRNESWMPNGLTRDVQDCVSLLGVLAQNLDGSTSRSDNQLDVSAFGFFLHIRHNRQCSRPRTNDQAAAFPGNLLLN